MLRDTVDMPRAQREADAKTPPSTTDARSHHARSPIAAFAGG